MSSFMIHARACLRAAESWKLGRRSKRHRTRHAMLKKMPVTKQCHGIEPWSAVFCLRHVLLSIDKKPINFFSTDDGNDCFCCCDYFAWRRVNTIFVDTCVVIIFAENKRIVRLPFLTCLSPFYNNGRTHINRGKKNYNAATTSATRDSSRDWCYLKIINVSVLLSITSANW